MNVKSILNKVPFTSLKTTLALYFIPVSIIPLLIISIYTSRRFEKSFSSFLIDKARSELDVFLNEVSQVGNHALLRLRSHTKNENLFSFFKFKKKEALSFLEVNSYNPAQINLYNWEGKYLESVYKKKVNFIPVLSKETKERLIRNSELVDRYFLEKENKFITIFRSLVRDRLNQPIGFIEEIVFFDEQFFSNLRQQRNVDVVVLTKELKGAGASFALPEKVLSELASRVYYQGNSTRGIQDPVYINIGESRFAGFIFKFPNPFLKDSLFGYTAIFIPTTTYDFEVSQIKVVLLYLTLFLTFLSLLLVFVLSNKIVKPIGVLVQAMKQLKMGRTELISTKIETPYEIEYLIISFNEMAKNIQSAKKALEQKLEELAQKNKEIGQAQSTVVQSAKMASLGQMVAGVAHELNNPIGFIYSNMHHLESYAKSIETLIRTYQTTKINLPEDTKATIEQLENKMDIDFLIRDLIDLSKSCMDGSRRVKDIVEGLRTFSRAEEVGFKPSSIEEGLRSTLKLLSHEIKNKIKVEEYYEPLPLIECNLSQLNQVFMNLISNAIHSIKEKGTLIIKTYLNKNQAMIEITDDGCGISEELIEKIFDPFFTTKKIGQGTGLGLSIAYGIVQKHKGSIEVKSELNRGSTFIIKLPISQSLDEAN